MKKHKQVKKTRQVNKVVNIRCLNLHSSIDRKNNEYVGL